MGFAQNHLFTTESDISASHLDILLKGIMSNDKILNVLKMWQNERLLLTMTTSAVE
jgi:hypothetical protein